MPPDADAHERCPTTMFALRVGGFALITDVYLSARTHLTPSPRRLEICNVNESRSLAVKKIPINPFPGLSVLLMLFFLKKGRK